MSSSRAAKSYLAVWHTAAEKDNLMARAEELGINFADAVRYGTREYIERAEARQATGSYLANAELRAAASPEAHVSEDLVEMYSEIRALGDRINKRFGR